MLGAAAVAGPRAGCAGGAILHFLKFIIGAQTCLQNTKDMSQDCDAVVCPLEGVRTSRALWWLRGRFAPAEADAGAGRLRVSL